MDSGRLRGTGLNPPALRAGVTALLTALAYDPAIARLCFVDVLAAGPHAAEARNAAAGDLGA